MVTAETAVVLPALLLVLALAISAIGHVLVVVRATDAARSGARAAARGDGDNEVRQVAQRELAQASPSQVQVRHADGLVQVSVTVPGASVLPFTHGLHWPAVTATAVSSEEQPTS